MQTEVLFPKKGKGGLNMISPEVLKIQLAILEERKKNTPFPVIAQMFGRSQGYIYKTYKQAIRNVLREPVEQIVKIENEKLNDLEAVLREIMVQDHYVISNGTAVALPLLDEQGRPVLDAEGEPIRVRLRDPGPVLAAVDKFLKVAERRAKLLGLDKPTKQSITNPEGTQSVTGVAIYIPDNGRSAPDDVVSEQ